MSRPVATYTVTFGHAFKRGQAKFPIVASARGVRAAVTRAFPSGPLVLTAPNGSWCVRWLAGDWGTWQRA